MRTEYQPDFLEAAVSGCLRGRRKGVTSLLITRFQLERERVYRTLDPDAREADFRRLHLKWFQEWGLEGPLMRAAGILKSCAGRIESLMYRKARSGKDEGAELYTNGEGVRRVVVALLPERFDDDAALEIFLRHELAHIFDMLDPAFGYIPSLHIQGATSTQLRLATDRYRVLWNAAIDARLARTGHPVASDRARHAATIDRAFSPLPPGRRSELTAEIWSGSRITHARLAEWAYEPRAAETGAGPGPGRTCPLCGMPTFVWADEASARAALPLAREEFADWTPEQGACARCIEVYAAVNASPEALAAFRESRPARSPGSPVGPVPG